jgi:putative transcriptional regulator
MPRQPKVIHPLRAIRTAAGLTQPQLGKLIGVSKDTIQSIENGRLEMSEDLAIKITRQTGCVLTCKETENGGSRYNVGAVGADTLRAYTKEDFDSYRRSMKQVDESDFEHTDKSAVHCIDLVLRMAKRQGEGTVAAIVQDFETFVAKLYLGYGLKPQFQAELRENWLPLNAQLEIDRDVANFPLLPLGVASKYLRLAEDFRGAEQASEEPKK